MRFGPAPMVNESEVSASCRALPVGQWVRVRFVDGTVRSGRIVAKDGGAVTLAFGRGAARCREFKAVVRALRPTVSALPVSPVSAIVAGPVAAVVAAVTVSPVPVSALADVATVAAVAGPVAAVAAPAGSAIRAALETARAAIVSAAMVAASTARAAVARFARYLAWNAPPDIA